MANQETQFLDDVIAKSRRKMLTVGLSSLAGAVGAALAPAGAYEHPKLSPQLRHL